MDDFTKYILDQDEKYQERLFKIKEIADELLPNCKIKISWLLPTYYETKDIIHFGCAKKHIAIYPHGEPIELLADELEKRKIPYSKGAIKFLHNKDIDYDFVRLIIKTTYFTNNKPKKTKPKENN